MVLPLLSKTSNILTKTEGTSQTFGQLISIVQEGQKDFNGTGTVDRSLGSKDIVVRLIPNESDSNVLGLNDSDKSKISIAAFSDAKEPSVAIKRDSSQLNGVSLNNFSNIVVNDSLSAIVVGSQIKSSEDIKKALIESQKVDMMISLHSQESEVIEFNSIVEISPEVNFVYNFFESDEGDVESQEDQTKDPLLKRDIFNVPRYVELKWIPATISNPLSNEERDESVEAIALRREAFAKPRGVTAINSTNFKNSFEKSKKRINPLERDGVKLQVIDLHKLDTAIDSTVNKSVFTNSVNTVFNIEEGNSVIGSLPIKK